MWYIKTKMEWERESAGGKRQREGKSVPTLLKPSRGKVCYLTGLMHHNHLKNYMGMILSLSGLCLRTKTQGKKRIFFEDLEDGQQKFKVTNRGFISCSQTHQPFLEVCL